MRQVQIIGQAKQDLHRLELSQSSFTIWFYNLDLYHFPHRC